MDAFQTPHPTPREPNPNMDSNNYFQCCYLKKIFAPNFFALSSKNLMIWDARFAFWQPDDLHLYTDCSLQISMKHFKTQTHVQRICTKSRQNVLELEKKKKESKMLLISSECHYKE